MPEDAYSRHTGSDWSTPVENTTVSAPNRLLTAGDSTVFIPNWQEVQFITVLTVWRYGAQ